jgi:hypothetical protein
VATSSTSNAGMVHTVNPAALLEPQGPISTRSPFTVSVGHWVMGAGPRWAAGALKGNTLTNG